MTVSILRALPGAVVLCLLAACGETDYRAPPLTPMSSGPGALGSTAAEARNPVITALEGNRFVATYSAVLPGTVLPSATGRDTYGNRTPIAR